MLGGMLAVRIRAAAETRFSPADGPVPVRSRGKDAPGMLPLGVLAAGMRAHARDHPAATCFALICACEASAAGVGQGE